MTPAVERRMGRRTPRILGRYAVGLMLSSSLLWTGRALAQSAPTAVAARETALTPDTRAADAILNRPVTVHLSHVSVRTAVDTIAAHARARLIYESEIFTDYTKPVSVHATAVPLRDVFAAALAETRLRVVPVANGALSVQESDGAQDARVGEIGGTVIDGRTRQPVRGAGVMLDDSVKRTTTDAQGHFQFSGISAGPHRVTVRSVGYARQTKVITVGDDGSATVSFVLEVSVNTLDQIVVTATGEQRYRELGHVVTKLNVDSLVKNAPITTMAQLLTGRVPGLQVMTGDGGTAGGDVALRLRGQTTINLDPQPIVILDGVRYKNTNAVVDPINGTGASIVEDRRPFNAEQRSPLNDLNVNDIETIEVVKGPSASTLYGPDAANGVIVITTKRGRVGKPTWNVYLHPNLLTATHEGRVAQTSYWGWGHDPNTGEPFNDSCRLVVQYEYHQCILDSITVAPTVDQSPDLTIVSQSRPQWQSGANVSGGTSALRYYLSAGYDSQVGLLKIPTGAAKILRDRLGESALSDAVRNPNTQQNINLRSNLAADLTSVLTVNLDAGFTQSSQRNIDASVYQTLASYGAVRPGCDPANPSQACGYDVSGAFLSYTTMDGNRFNGTANAVYQPFPWLGVNATFGTDIGSSADRGLSPQGGQYDGDGGSVYDYRRNNDGRSGLINATARTHPGFWSFQSTLGTQYSYTHADGLNGFGQNLAPGSSSINTATYQYTTQEWSETVSLSTYGEEVVGFKDRLFLTGALRFDGSTSFGDAYHARPVPKVGISWIASDEPFLQHLPGVTQLRFRASYGSSSRYPTSAMKLGSIQTGQNTISGQTVNVFWRDGLANPLLRPERSREAEYGADATLIGNMVDVGITFYNRRTDDQLQQLINPQGVPTQWANVGNVSNHGFEATATARLVDTRRIQASVLFSASYNTSKLISLGPKSPVCNGYDCYRVGYPLGAIFDRRIVGVADTVGGGQDSIAFENEIVYSAAGYIGVLYPPHTYTMTPSLSLFDGRLRLSTLLDRGTGFMVPDRLANQYGLNLASLLKGSPLLDQARALVGCCAYDPGDFTRWRELSISTDLPRRLMRFALLSRGTISFQVRNLAMWTKYKGGDPESLPGQGAQGQGSLTSGVAGISQPRSWSISFDFTP